MKFAIFISGPFRYLDKVLKQLNEFYADNYNYDIYIHLWDSDKGNKKRGLEIIDSNLNELTLAYPKIKKIIIEEQPDEKEVIETIENVVGQITQKNIIGHSSLTAMFGMFIAINKLYDEAILSQEDYSHILRLRTDISFHDKTLAKIFESPKKDTIYISQNPLIDESKISDHSMLVPFKYFSQIWKMQYNSTYIQEYYESFFNPEILLGKRIPLLNCKIEVVWKRFVNYNVVYLNHHQQEPTFIKSLSPNEMFNFYYNEKQKQIALHDFNYIIDYRRTSTFKIFIIKMLRKNRFSSKIMDIIKSKIIR